MIAECACGCALPVSPGWRWRSGHHTRDRWPSPATLSDAAELVRFVAFRPDGPSPMPKHDRFIDAWRVERVRFELARAAGRLS